MNLATIDNNLPAAAICILALEIGLAGASSNQGNKEGESQ
jgi:hypothetical protein